MKTLVALLLFLPFTAFAEHESTTTIQVHPGLIALNPLDPTKNPGQALTINDTRGEFETINAQETLRAAINLLQPKDAEKLPVTDEAIAILRKKISTKAVKGTDFVKIIARADTKKEAVEISTAVANAYITRRKEAEIDRAKRAVAALDQELLNQSNLVAKNRIELTKLIQEYGIPYFDAGNESPLGMTEQEMLTAAREKLTKFEVMRDQLEIQINNLTELTDDKLFLYIVALDLPENKVAQHYIKYQEARTEKLALFEQGLNHKDPKIKATSDRAQESIENAQKEVLVLKANLKTNLELVKRQVGKMSQMVDERAKGAIDLSLKENQYNLAKEAYEQSRALLREMKVQQQETRALLKMPRDPVTIHEQAE